MSNSSACINRKWTCVQEVDPVCLSVAGAASWDVVVNNANAIPPSDARRSLEEGQNMTFSSYNAASVNKNKNVVFRARSTG